MIRKPAYGGPCNRCGLCCMTALCDLGQHVFKRLEFPGPCPALEPNEDGTYTCGLVAHTERYISQRQLMEHGLAALRRAALFLIGSDDGCDARFNSEPRNEAYTVQLYAKWLSKGAKFSRAAKRVWGA
jgi:hypothetical protein